MTTKPKVSDTLKKRIKKAVNESGIDRFFIS
jgi:hypothetical protein